MSLSETEKDKILDAFFQTRLAPIAASVKARGEEFFPVGPDASAASYFIDRTDIGSSYVHEIDAADLTGELSRMWTNDPHAPELAALAAEIVALAEALGDDPDDGPDNVSPFVYAMF